ncbi:MAG: sarcosine oxidase subunit gamma family protein [Pseudomonadota bacterium]
MVKLISKSAGAGLFPVSGPGLTVEEAAPAQLTSMAAHGTAGWGALGTALKAAHGVALANPGELTAADGVRCAWFSASHVMLMGPAPDASLAAHAALTDQSDAWCHVILSGPRVAEMLAYLTPVDLREAAFPEGSAARSQIGHMNALILRSGSQRYELLVFRSMAGTLAHEIKEAIAAL